MPVRAFQPLQPRARCGLGPARSVVVRNSAKNDAPISAELAIFSALVAASSAQPAQAADVDGVVNATVDTVKATGEALKGAYTYLEAFGKSAVSTYEQVSPSISSTFEKAAPVVKQGFDEVSKVAGPAISKAVPAVRDSAAQLLKESGVDVDSVSKSTSEASKVASDAYTKATPTLTKVYNFLTTSDPQTLGKAALALVATYYLFPFVVRTLVDSFRGFSGELSPAKAVDFVAALDSACLVDIRPLKEKAATGVPDVPSSARGRFIELEQATIERRLRGQLRSADAVETRITALEIQSLKRVNKGSTIMLMDKSGGSSARDVAKELARLGFRSVYVVTGGFQGWQASKLQVKPPVPGMRDAGAGGVVNNIIGTISTRQVPRPAPKAPAAKNSSK